MRSRPRPTSADAGDNTLFGNNGDDVLIGGGGNDTFAAGAGNDVIDGGTGNDAMSGGSGNDTYFVDNLGDAVYENANEGTDTVQSSITYTLGANVENLTLTGSGNINGTGNSGNNILTGNSGANTLDGGAGADTMIGGLGNDVINGGTGNDAMSGGDGDDTYVVDSLGDAVVENVGEGTDKVIATVNNVTLASNVEIGAVGLATGLTLTGNAGDNILFGASGNDVLNGGAGNDAFAAGAGNDIINGGVGNDAMSGGAGDDTFVFTLGDGFDQVTDFTAGDSSGDLIALTGYGVASFAQLQAFMSQDGSDVKIAFDSNNQITLQGVTLGQLNQNDFQLA